jgi:hypothetical protein
VTRVRGVAFGASPVFPTTGMPWGSHSCCKRRRYFLNSFAFTISNYNICTAHQR